MQISLNNFLKKADKSYIKHSVEINEFVKFLSALKKHVSQLEAAQSEGGGRESEEHLKNIFNYILNESIYARNPLNTSGRIDSAIFDDKRNVAAIFEFKTPRNTVEMISTDNLHKKALFEAIYYLYTERLAGNVNIKNIIVTDTKQFFIFDAKQFIDSKIEKLCRDYDVGKTNLTGTSDIYNQIAAIIAGRDFEYAYFDFHKTFNAIKDVDLSNIDRENDRIKDLVKFYKFLHPNFMLREYKPGDANQLNQKFYTELLYILGLQETKDKKIILSDTKNTFMAEVLEKLAEEKQVFNAEQRESIALELIITWLNRVLFLKLFEGQLVTFNGNDKNFAFLSSDKLQDFDSMNTLFFSVLGKPINERKDENKYPNIPYLNSSLFEVSETERDYFLISSLRNNLNTELYKSSVLRNSYKNTTSVNLLKYLLDFLDAFDFASENTDDELREQSKDIINSAVLGLIFERLNGYKDGSYFTPSTITEYMARETIDRAVINKFNAAFNIHCSTIEELKNWLSDKHYKVDDLRRYNEIINSLRVCDPAVGSGHFPVSVLNYVIYLKSYLGILCNEAGKISEQIEIVNDTLLITNAADGSIVKYERGNQATHSVQQTIFEEKRIVIENCLFAVDINPKSVQICRLRLWIELLKNTYYLGNSDDMRILPNIDINVKCGNSLISKYKPVVGKSISDSSDVDGRTKFGKQIAEYKKLVADYKSAENKDKKREVNSALLAIKSQITSAVQLKLELDLESQKTNKQIIEDNVYHDSMEWIIEFPEALDNDGRFLGFDIVIGNPPYIDSEAMVNTGLEWLREYAVKNYIMARGNFDIYIPFFNLGFNLLSDQGVLSYISPDKWLNKSFGNALRTNLLDNIYAITRSGDVFDSARVDSIITFIAKEKSDFITSYKQNGTELNKITKVPKSTLKSPYQLDFMFSEGLDLIYQVENTKGKLSDLSVCENACATADAYLLKNIIADEQNPSGPFYKIINTGTLSKYAFRWGVKAMKYLKDDYLHPVVDKLAFKQTFKGAYSQKTEQPKLIMKGMTLLDVALDNTGSFIAGKSTLVVCDGDIDKLKFLSAILNSKLIIYYITHKYPASSYLGGITFNKDMINNLPVPSLSPEQQKPIIALVNDILAIKATDPMANISVFEDEINALVYELYGLSNDEIDVINFAGSKQKSNNLES